MLALFSKFMFSRLKVGQELLSNFQNFDYKKFVPNTKNSKSDF